MRCITREEAELIRTFSLALRMKNHRKIVDHFENKFQEDPDNTENALNYGICMSLYIIVDENDSDKPGHMVAMNKAFTKCLEHDSEWWLVRYLRSELNQRIPDEVLVNADDYNFPFVESVNPWEDCSVLIEQQKANPKKYSYFLSPYLAQIRTSLYKGNLTDVFKIYKDGLAAAPNVKSPFDFPYLTQPFYDSIVHLRKVEESEKADEIKKCALSVFPNSRHLRTA